MPLPEIDRSVELNSLPGRDRDGAMAMLAQSRHRNSRPLDDIQVAHLLVIGYRAGVAAGEVRGRTAAAADLADQLDKRARRAIRRRDDGRQDPTTRVQNDAEAQCLMEIAEDVRSARIAEGAERDG
jgi:hypothetical protein